MSTDSETVTKVTSFGSQYSSSNNGTILNNTPHSEAVEEVDSAPVFDPEEVIARLATIQEAHNDAVDEATVPEVPVNSPVVSPDPSVVLYTMTRGHGLSAIGDRLAELMLRNDFIIEDSASNCAAPSSDPSANENNSAFGSGSESGSATSEALSDISKEDVEIQIGLGSPKPNPRFYEYMTFATYDLRLLSPNAAAAAMANPAADAMADPTTDSSVEPNFNFTVPEGASSSSSAVGLRESLVRDSGVRENTTWAEECEEGIRNELQRLEQLARDENNIDDSHTVEEYFVNRLNRILQGLDRKFPVSLEGQPNLRPA